MIFFEYDLKVDTDFFRIRLKNSNFGLDLIENESSSQKSFTTKSKFIDTPVSCFYHTDTMYLRIYAINEHNMK